MSKSKFKLFCQRCVLSVCSLLLLACSSSDDNNNTTSVLSPSLLRDFPTPFGTVAIINGIPTTVGISTTGTGDGLTVYGQAFWTSSLAEIDQFEFSINDTATPFDTETPVSSPYSWQQILAPSEPLDIGVNSFNILAKVNGLSLLDLFVITRGTSWMREVAIQYDGGRSRWLVLDVARGALLEVSLTDGSKTIISSLAAGEGTGNALVEPVDFVVDGDRALVVDRGAAAIVAIDLTVGGGTEGDRTLYADTSAIPLPFAEPVAIDGPVIEAAEPGKKFAYIADRDLRTIVKVDITANGGGERNFISIKRDEFGVPVNPAEPADMGIKMPIDLAYYGATNSLFVSDAAVNGIVEIDLELETGMELLLYETDADGVVVKDDDDNPVESTQEVNYSAIRNVVIADNTLYVTDGGLRVIAVDIDSEPSTRGQRTVLSGVTDSDTGLANVVAVVPDVFNLFGSPEALAVDSPIDPKRLLVVDNLLGVLVEVDLGELVDGELVDLGNRCFFGGGAILIDSPVSTPEVERCGNYIDETTRETPALGAVLENPVDILVGGSAIATLDRLNNRIIVIDTLSGERTVNVPNIGSPAETDLVDPVTFQLSADGSYYIVDAGTDQVIQVPSSGGVRAVASESSDDEAHVEFDNPVDSVLVDTFEDFVLESPVLYVLDAGLNDVIKVVLADGSRSLMGLNLGCLSNPIAMLRNNVILTDAETEFTTEIDELLIADQSSHELYSVDLLNDNACVSVANYGGTVDAIDIALDTRSVDPANHNVLVLDAEANAIVPVGVGVSISDVVGANNRGEVAESYVSLSNEADEFILPVAMGFDRLNHRAYVLDSAIRSVFVVDLRWRVESTHEAVGVDDIDFNLAPGINVKKSEICEQDPGKVGDECKVVVDAQRVIISRGTALNCDAAIATCN